MLIDTVMLMVSLGLILLASMVFTNAIEQLGSRLNLHQGAIGSVLAAVGTALPETVIPIIAIMFAQFSGDITTRAANVHTGTEVAIGAIAGAPFMLCTLAFAVTGTAVLVYSALKRRPRRMVIDSGVLTRDLVVFIVLYSAAILTSFVHEIYAVKVAVAVALLAAYVLYLKITMIAHEGEQPEIEPLYFSRLLKTRPSLAWIYIQLPASLGLMVAAAHMFVTYTEGVSLILGVPPMILSLVITPIATELPEKFNSIIWIGRKKDILAVGNITGAMVFQSCFPVVFGILFTPWDLMENHGITMVSAVLALLSAVICLVWVRVRKTLNPYVLLIGGVLYVVFFAYLLANMHDIHPVAH